VSQPNIFLAKTTNRSLLKSSDQTKPITIHFEGNQKAILDPTVPGAKAWGEMIDYLQNNNRPVYVETDAASGVITQLCAPSPERVWEIDETGEEVVYVSFHTSTALRYLRRNHPAFPEILRSLKRALEQDATVLVTSANLPLEIIDVRELPALFKQDAAKESPTTPDDSDDALSRVTPERALELFKKIAAISCIPVFSANAIGTCIPFKNPANGCWVRAHLMAFMLMDEKETPGKIWSTGKDLHTRSTNVPNCIVRWGWHVATTLMVIYPDGREEKMVFDPSMFDRPVSVDEWKLGQTDPKIKVSYTEWWWYRFGVKDVDRATANEKMEEFRIELKIMWEKLGPPPYDCPKSENT